MSTRLDFLATRDQRAAAQRRRTLAEALATDVPAWARIHVEYNRAGGSRHVLTVWTDRYIACDVDNAAALMQRIMANLPEIAWCRSHDIDLATGAVYASPEPWQIGYLPEEDRAFSRRWAPWLQADFGLREAGWFNLTPAPAATSTQEPRAAA